MVAQPVCGGLGVVARWSQALEELHGRRVRAEPLSERLSAPEVPAWVCLALCEECTEGMERWLLIRRNADEPDKNAPWLAYGPAETNEEELVRGCDARWQIERVPAGQIRAGEGGCHTRAWISTRCVRGRHGTAS